MAHLVPACTFCLKNFDFPGNKPNSELPEITVISSCGHLFHLTCIEKIFGDETVVPCENKTCAENIERRCLKEVNFETVLSPDAPSVAALETIIVSKNSLLKEKKSKITKLYNDIDKLKEQIIIKSTQLESTETKNSKLVGDNRELQTKYEKCIADIKQLKLRQSKFEDVEKQNLLELQTRNDECHKIREKLKLQKARLESAEKQNSLLDNRFKENELTLESIKKQNKYLIDRNKVLQTEKNECEKIIEKLEQHRSQLLETVAKQNLHLVNHGMTLQIENVRSIKTIENPQKCINNIETTDEISDEVVIVDLKRRNGDNIRKSKSKIEINKNLDETIARVKMDYDRKNDENIGKKTESPKVPPTILRKIKSENNDNYEIIDLSDQAESGAESAKLSTSGQSPVLCANQKQSKFETKNENYQSTVFRWNLEGRDQQHILNSFGEPQKFSELQKRIFHSFDEPQKFSELQKSVRCAFVLSPSSEQISKNEDRETKKRTWNDVQEREPDYDAKRHKGNPSLTQPEYLRPFSFTGLRFGPFSQVMFAGNFAYTSGEYLLLGDGVIYGILRTALQTDKYFDELMKKSPYNFARRSIRALDRHLTALPCLPKKVMICIGDIDSATSNRSYFEIKESLQSLFKTAYQKGVKKIVMIPPVKHSKWHERRYQLDHLLGQQAETAYDWEYYYMQELSDVMSEFKVRIQSGDTYFITAEDNLKLTEKIENYTAEKKNEKIDASTSSDVQGIFFE